MFLRTFLLPSRRTNKIYFQSSRIISNDIPILGNKNTKFSFTDNLSAQFFAKNCQRQQTALSHSAQNFTPVVRFALTYSKCSCKLRKLNYIQSACELSTEMKREQELKSLKRINDSFQKIVIVKDDITKT